MATKATNPFGVAIAPANAGAFSIPTVQDEKNTYLLWGWTWTESTANPTYNQAGPELKVQPPATSYVISSPDIHGDTEGDDVWSYLQAYARRTSGNVGYLQRAQGWRDYYVNRFENSPEQANDEGFLYDHFYGWGLSQFGAFFNDAAASAEALRIVTTLHDWWAVGGRSGPGGTWPVPGNFDIAHYGHRGPARNLRVSIEVADATGNAKAVELRDRLIDIWLQSPDWAWVDVGHTMGMYWVSSEQMGYYNVVPPLNYNNGDRAVSSFHIALVCEAFFRAWLSPNVTQARKDALRVKIVAMATWMLHYGMDPTYRYCSDTLGIFGNGSAWWNYSLGATGTVTDWDGSYTVAIVNLLVMGYKFTGNRNFLDATPANNLYPAKYCFNRGTKNIFGSTTLREAGSDGQTVSGGIGVGAGPENVAYHFVDTRFDSSTANIMLYNNKGELQYTYLIFENGGAPTVFP